MEIIRVLEVLRHRWRWVVLGVLVSALVAIASAYKVSVFPPKLEQETTPRIRIGDNPSTRRLPTVSVRQYRQEL